MRPFRTLGILAATLTLLLAAGCGSDDLEGNGGDGGKSDAKGSVVVGGQDFTESQVLASIYEQLLEAEGYTVQTKLVTTRDVYLPELAKGNVDVVPDYLAGLTDYLNTDANGPDAPLVSSNDPDATLAALEPLAEANGISILPPSEATDQNAFIVTQEFADANDLDTLSDLAALGQPIKLGAPEDCQGRADCEGGLTNVYGLEITEIVPLDFASSQLKDAVNNGEVAARRDRHHRRHARGPRTGAARGRQGHPAGPEPHPGGQLRLPGRQPRPGGPVQRSSRRR